MSSYNGIKFFEIEHLKSIGKSLKEIRKAHNITQTEIAEHIGYSQESISHLENGKTDNLVMFLKYITYLEDKNIYAEARYLQCRN